MASMLSFPPSSLLLWGMIQFKLRHHTSRMSLKNVYSNNTKSRTLISHIGRELMPAALLVQPGWCIHYCTIIRPKSNINWALFILHRWQEKINRTIASMSHFSSFRIIYSIQWSIEGSDLLLIDISKKEIGVKTAINRKEHNKTNKGSLPLAAVLAGVVGCCTLCALTYEEKFFFRWLMSLKDLEDGSSLS